METDLLVIGGGVASLSAAVSAVKNGIENVFILEKDKKLGGVLSQCIHSGFGMLTFNEELTGNEYAKKFIDLVDFNYIKIFTDTTALKIEIKKREIYAVNQKYGYFKINFKALILATGCYEESVGSIPGSRPAGIMSAGMAQKFINTNGFLPGKNVVIFGTNIVGLTMARRLTLEGAKVLCVIENLPYCRGPLRDEYLCIKDFNIPLYYSHTVVRIYGKKRIEKIKVAKVYKNLKPVKNSEFEIKLDCLLIAKNLIPENNLLSRTESVKIDKKTSGPLVDQNMQTTISFVFACGNNVYIHNNADILVKESSLAGKAAANFIKNLKTNNLVKPNYIKVKFSKHFSFIFPRIINLENLSNVTELYLHPNKVYENVTILIGAPNKTILRLKKKRLVPSMPEKIVLSNKDLLKLKLLKRKEIYVFLEDKINTQQNT